MHFDRMIGLDELRLRGRSFVGVALRGHPCVELIII